jgi:hypothetical protein
LNTIQLIIKRNFIWIDIIIGMNANEFHYYRRSISKINTPK